MNATLLFANAFLPVAFALGLYLCEKFREPLVDGRSRLSGTRICAAAFYVAISLLIAFLSFLEALTVLRSSEHEAAIAAKAGVLGQGRRNNAITLAGDRRVKIYLGWSENHQGSSFEYEGGPFNENFGFKGKFFAALDDAVFRISGAEGTIRASLVVRNREGRLVAELRNNEWSTKPESSWDRNYTSDTLEVIDDAGRPVLQARIDGNSLKLNGIFYDSTGHGVSIAPAEDCKRSDCAAVKMLGPDTEPQSLKRLFKYPSDLHLGDYVSSPKPARSLTFPP